MQKGSSKYGSDVIVGSTEYMKRWREANKDKHKLQVAKYRARQKQLILAAKIAEADGIPIEQALKEVEGKLESLTTLRKVLIEEGRIPASHSGDFAPVQVVDEPQNPFILEQAARFNLSYDEALEIMDVIENPSKWDEALAAKRDDNARKKGE